MISLICLFFPGLVALSIENYFDKKRKENYKLVLNYASYTFICNFLSMLLMYFVFQVDNNLENSIDLYPGVATKYMLISLIIVFLLVVLKLIVSRNVVMDFEIKKQ